MVPLMSETLRENVIQRITVTESKTVAELLADLGLSTNHVVLIDGKRVPLTFEIQENESVVVLPLITGG